MGVQLVAAERAAAWDRIAAVGTGLGLAKGAQLLDRDRQVIGHICDGGMTILLGEFMTSVEHRLQD